MATVQKSKVETRSPTAPAKQIVGSAPSKEKIAARAYEIWQASGRPHGHDQDHWFQAERELRAGKV
jgi:hypothetical protein